MSSDFVLDTVAPDQLPHCGQARSVAAPPWVIELDSELLIVEPQNPQDCAIVVFSV
jgi:hypothetical protein